MHRTAPAISPGDEAGAPRCASSRCSPFGSVFSVVDRDTTRVDSSFLRPCSASILSPSLPPSAAAACGLATTRATRRRGDRMRDVSGMQPAPRRRASAQKQCGVSARKGWRTFAPHKISGQSVRNQAQFGTVFEHNLVLLYRGRYDGLESLDHFRRSSSPPGQGPASGPGWCGTAARCI